MEKVKQILNELTKIKLYYGIMDELISHWNYILGEYGFVPIQDILNWLENSYLIDPVDTDPSYSKWGFRDSLIETRNFQVSKDPSGRFRFGIIFPDLYQL